MVIGANIAQAFDTLYHLEPEVAEKTARQWRDYAGFSEGRFRALIGILDKEDPDHSMQPAAA